MSEGKPFHEGEIAVQEKVGERAMAERNGRVIGQKIMRGALGFLAKQPFVVLGSVDDSGRPWASILVGEPGFVRSPDEARVTISLTDAHNAHDPLAKNIEQYKQVGLLALELATCRRLRINGSVKSVNPERIDVEVQEAYPNCPKHIQRRHLKSISPKATNHLRTGQDLGENQRRLIQSADTLFVASIHPKRGVDASHRGGHAGFVQIAGTRTVRVPDYGGNSMFNTLGNVHVHAFLGLAFWDFDASRILQATGPVRIQYDADDPEGVTGGTHRFWQLEIEQWREWDLPQTMQWDFLDASPHNPKVRQYSGNLNPEQEGVS